MKALIRSVSQRGPHAVTENWERICLMPLVQITMLQGRTADQKRKIAKRVTDTG